MADEEKLDFCRIKKIFDKGFGFLSSVYYEQDVFFHFSAIRDKETREKLEDMKRGEVYAFYTSKKVEKGRKVEKIWTDISKVDKYLLPDFIEKLVDELNDGKTNLYEVTAVVQHLRENDLLPKAEFQKILLAPKTENSPYIIEAMLIENEKEKMSGIIESITENKNSFEEKIIELINKIE